MQWYSDLDRWARESWICFRGVASCRQRRQRLELGEYGPAGRLGAAILKRGPAARRN